MANELKIQLITSGLTLAARILSPTGTIIQNNIAMSESGSSGFYYGSVPGNLDDGTYTIVFVADSVIYGSGELIWVDGQELQTSGLTEAEKTRLADIHGLLMLDSNREVVHTPFGVTVGSGENQISISITSDEETNIVTGNRN